MTNLLAEIQDKIRDKCDEVKALLISKNKHYGNSALYPVRIFSQADPTEQIKVRIDDKLSRFKRGVTIEGESEEQNIKDLAGYLVLLLIANELQAIPSVEDKWTD